MTTIRHGDACIALVAGRTVFEHADDLAVEVPTSCGRSGRCHECIVEITRGQAALSPPTEAEGFLRGDYRLACQAVVERSDLEIVFAPLRRRPRILTDGLTDAPMELDPAIRRVGDEVRRSGVTIDRYRGRLLGLAVDLGTTTVVADLVDLETGHSLRRAAFENPQRFGGSDIMSRISYDGGPGRGELQKAVASGLNRAIMAMTTELGVSRQAIYEVVIVANSTMRDLFFKLDVQSIGQRPYKSTTEHELLAGLRQTTALTTRARLLGLKVNARAEAYGLPLIASHVGADAAAALLALNITREGTESVMLLDIGTNTEVVLRHQGRLIAASCPAGPAFESGLVRYGMAAYEGAIERITRSADGGFAYHTIGDLPPVGLCGSGLIDLLAVLCRDGLMTPKGVFTADRRAQTIMIVPEHGITLSREDASNLAQAKAANYCGQFIVLRLAGLAPGSLDRLYLAGGFANYVDVENAIRIGLLAPVSPERVIKAGNAALQGARIALQSCSKRAALEALVRGIEHVELETTADFFEIFVEGCQFKPMPASFEPSARQRSRA